jgi:hypothetical protein
MTEGLHLTRTGLLCHKCRLLAISVYGYTPKEGEDGVPGGVFECGSCKFKEWHNDKEASALLKLLERETEKRKRKENFVGIPLIFEQWFNDGKKIVKYFSCRSCGEKYSITYENGEDDPCNADFDWEDHYWQFRSQQLCEKCYEREGRPV